MWTLGKVLVSIRGQLCELDVLFYFPCHRGEWMTVHFFKVQIMFDNARSRALALVLDLVVDRIALHRIIQQHVRPSVVVEFSLKIIRARRCLSSVSIDGEA